MLRTVAALALLLTSTHAFAQGTDPVRYFQLNFVVRETEGTKVVNSRGYVTQVSSRGTNALIRTGSKIPVAGKDGTYSYVEIGANMDCNVVKVEDGQLLVRVSVDISSLLQELTQTAPNTQLVSPIIRQNRWSGETLLPFKKPTILFSSDDLTSKRQMQVELTATQIK